MLSAEIACRDPLVSLAGACHGGRTAAAGRRGGELHIVYRDWRVLRVSIGRNTVAVTSGQASPRRASGVSSQLSDGRGSFALAFALASGDGQAA